MADGLQQNQQVYDINIIGGGPTGLFAAFYCGMRNATCNIIDSLPELGGQLATLYPEKFIYDVGGFPKIRSRDLVEQLKQQAFQYDTTAVHLNERVEGLHRRDDGIFELRTDKQVHLSKAIIICAGIGVFTPKPLPGENVDAFPDDVFYFIDNLDKFRNKHVLVVGGGDSAVDFALMLDGAAKQVTLIHRRDQFRAHEESVRQLHASGVEVRTFYELKALHGDGRLKRATLIQNKTQETVDIPVDAVVSGLGFSASLGPINEWGLEIENNEIVVNTRMETNIPGIYAAGDIVTYPGKVKLIATGFGEAPTAVNNAKTYIDPKARLSPGHSSNRKE
ncbi:NAD(P)/FAD-dependent oxidoreductase [Alicyclobacillus cycloheptanicus]|uniref:Ferredoxin--NADP reductase n=1 Tax=Alicyclobacillus cycloheptanicus TaxID=1457 RepID=A0ABT9XDI4_9BACL|nr:NAD(P)/FAD-dependent oxidoreductase [Alicyclobacillus cycloheptanicus]MDQ0188364.1 thioredoxin reductase (NADPH) [Alicyclobacillus cycloheptanicus]